MYKYTLQNGESIKLSIEVQELNKVYSLNPFFARIIKAQKSISSHSPLQIWELLKVKTGEITFVIKDRFNQIQHYFPMLDYDDIYPQIIFYLINNTLYLSTEFD